MSDQVDQDVNQAATPGQAPEAPAAQPATLHTDGAALACRVLSLSASGAVIRLDAPPPPLAGGSALSLADGPPSAALAGHLAWREGRTLGLRFAPPSQDYARLLQREVLKLKDPRERRKFPRCSVLMSGTVRALGIEVPCVVQNISLGGARLRVMERLHHEGEAILNIPRFGDFDAAVSWQSDDAMGVQFLMAPQDVVDLIGEALPRVIPPSFRDPI